MIDLIDTTNEEPAAMDTKEEEQQVHLHQGSLDGACEPYCLLMSLLICGLADRYTPSMDYIEEPGSLRIIHL